MLWPFCIVALLFPLWGFANDVTNPLVRAFKDIFLISNAESSLVQFAFYLGYGIMALPAAIFIRSFTYKSGILAGLALYAIGAALFIPASIYAEFYYFLAALCVLTCGLALLEVTANPYILSMGHPETATRRLNFAQAFNPVGSLTGMFVASNYILGELQGRSLPQRTARAASRVRNDAAGGSRRPAHAGTRRLCRERPGCAPGNAGGGSRHRARPLCRHRGDRRGPLSRLPRQQAAEDHDARPPADARGVSRHHGPFVSQPALRRGRRSRRPFTSARRSCAGPSSFTTA